MLTRHKLPTSYTQPRSQVLSSSRPLKKDPGNEVELHKEGVCPVAPTIFKYPNIDGLQPIPHWMAAMTSHKNQEYRAGTASDLRPTDHQATPGPLDSLSE